MIPTEIVIATQNEGKIREIGDLLSDIPIRLIPALNIPDVPAVIESERSLQGNAIKKAQALFEFTGIPSLADDTGLEVDSLDGRPGVLSARYAGDDATDADNRALLLHELEGIANRRARFSTVAAFVDHLGIYLFEGTCEGTIRLSESGSEGFGYDAVFIPQGFDASFAEMSVSAKNKISHRGKALAKFRAFMHERTSSD
jgi:XTP/dITP diphosphohydrolase